MSNPCKSCQNGSALNLVCVDNKCEREKQLNLICANCHESFIHRSIYVDNFLDYAQCSIEDWLEGKARSNSLISDIDMLINSLQDKKVKLMQFLSFFEKNKSKFINIQNQIEDIRGKVKQQQLMTEQATTSQQNQQSAIQNSKNLQQQQNLKKIYEPIKNLFRFPNENNISSEQPLLLIVEQSFKGIQKTIKDCLQGFMIKNLPPFEITDEKVQQYAKTRMALIQKHEGVAGGNIQQQFQLQLPLATKQEQQQIVSISEKQQQEQKTQQQQMQAHQQQEQSLVEQQQQQGQEKQFSTQQQQPNEVPLALQRSQRITRNTANNKQQTPIVSSNVIPQNSRRRESRTTADKYDPREMLDYDEILSLNYNFKYNNSHGFARSMGITEQEQQQILDQGVTAAIRGVENNLKQEEVIIEIEENPSTFLNLKKNDDDIQDKSKVLLLANDRSAADDARQNVQKTTSQVEDDEVEIEIESEANDDDDDEDETHDKALGKQEKTISKRRRQQKGRRRNYSNSKQQQQAYVSSSRRSITNKQNTTSGSDSKEKTTEVHAVGRTRAANREQQSKQEEEKKNNLGKDVSQVKGDNQDAKEVEVQQESESLMINEKENNNNNAGNDQIKDNNHDQLVVLGVSEQNNQNDSNCNVKNSEIVEQTAIILKDEKVSPSSTFPIIEAANNQINHNEDSSASNSRNQQVSQINMNKKLHNNSSTSNSNIENEQSDLNESNVKKPKYIKKYSDRKGQEFLKNLTSAQSDELIADYNELRNWKEVEQKWNITKYHISKFFKKQGFLLKDMKDDEDGEEEGQGDQENSRMNEEKEDNNKKYGEHRDGERKKGEDQGIKQKDVVENENNNQQELRTTQIDGVNHQL